MIIIPSKSNPKLIQSRSVELLCSYYSDVSCGDYDGDGFEHPNYDEDGEW